MGIEIPAIELARLRQLRAECSAAESALRAATAEVEVSRLRFHTAAQACVRDVAPDVRQPAIDLTRGTIVEEGE